ncbi:hypothetical protein HNR01_004347 [Methylorubrum rhodesianum]|uniref:Uncharacterized protein n=2 Tax=Methylobacteriaceae TaxID=119045 RepID=A0ABU9Z8I7_9HYPH|nr:hypothetical protein [Methylorubrum rhodesianum]MBB5764703.1 hypothetical protein [Methylorubrum rhodesianum]
MKTAQFVGATMIGFISLAGVTPARAVDSSLSGYQGAWVLDGRDCADVFSSGGKVKAFKKPVDIFAPAFVISGKRLRTPMASCQIKSTQPNKDRHVFLLDCTNSVASNEVRVVMAISPDRGLKRYYGDQDPTGVAYRRCS